MNKFRQYWESPYFLICLMSLIKLISFLFIHPDYGFHRDEFLYLAMADHLASGFFEIPPLTPFIIYLYKSIFGDSLFAIRLLTSFFGALIVFFTGLMAKEIGAKRWGQFFACLSIIVSGGYLRVSILLVPDNFLIAIWSIAFWLLVKVIKTDELKYWVWLGIICGLGLLTKYTMFLFGFGLTVGLLFSNQRTHFQNYKIYLAGVIALILFLPNLIWQIQMDWPFFEHMGMLSKSQLANNQLAGFLIMQFMFHLLVIPVWLVGLYSSFKKDFSLFRVLGIIFITSLIILIYFSGKHYYLMPAYSPLFAIGGYVFEKWVLSKKRKKIIYPYLGFIFIGFIVFTPFGLPFLSVQNMHSFSNEISKYGFRELLRWEDGKIHHLPQEFADMIGWEEKAIAVSEVFHSLTEEEKSKCTILSGDYGIAGSISYYRKKYNLPEPISPNASYYTWGPGNKKGVILIAIGVNKNDLERYYEKVDLVKSVTQNYVRENQFDIFVCRKPKSTLQDVWNNLRKNVYG